MCIRREVLSRLTANGLRETRLPLNTPADKPHVPILTSSNLHVAKRVIIYFGESAQELGIFAYRVIGKESIASGSAINLLNAIQESSLNPPAIVIANPGQSIWYNGGKSAVSPATWSALPRETAVSSPMVIDERRNRVPKNENVASHVRYVLDEVLGHLTDKTAKVDIIGVGDGALEVVERLQIDWIKWEKRVEAVVVGASHVWKTEFVNQQFKEFWGKRGRAYVLSPEELETPLNGRKQFGCNVYSAGEPHHVECIMPRAYKNILRYLQLVEDAPNYAATEQYIPPADDADEEVL